MALSDKADDDTSFRGFCENATDSQLEHILKKEWDAGRENDYRDAKAEAESRGWSVRKGNRVA